MIQATNGMIQYLIQHEPPSILFRKSNRDSNLCRWNESINQRFVFIGSGLPEPSSVTLRRAACSAARKAQAADKKGERKQVHNQPTRPSDQPANKAGRLWLGGRVFTLKNNKAFNSPTNSIYQVRVYLGDIFDKDPNSAQVNG